MSDLLVHLYHLPEKKPVKEGYVVRRALPYEKPVVLSWAAKHFAMWLGEIDVAFSRQPVSCFIALHQQRVVGFACHEATYRGFFGPEGVMDAHRGQGLGTTMMMECLHAMKEMGYAYGVVGDAGPVDYYVKTVGAIVIPDSSPGIYTEKISA